MKVNPLNYKISDFNILDPQKGRVLISEPFMADPYFKRSVVLLIEHNDEGSFGFILNKSFEFRVCDTLKDFPEFDLSVYMGRNDEFYNMFYQRRKMGWSCDRPSKLEMIGYVEATVNEVMVLRRYH